MRMSDREYTLAFEDRGSYLYARITGRDSYAASMAYWPAIADEVERTGFKRILVHENLQGIVTEGEIYEILMNLRGSALMGIRIAFYDESYNLLVEYKLALEALEDLDNFIEPVNEQEYVAETTRKKQISRYEMIEKAIKALEERTKDLKD